MLVTAGTEESHLVDALSELDATDVAGESYFRRILLSFAILLLSLALACFFDSCSSSEERSSELDSVLVVLLFVVGLRLLVVEASAEGSSTRIDSSSLLLTLDVERLTGVLTFNSSE